MPTVPRVEGPSVEERGLPNARLEARSSQVPFQSLASAGEQVGGALARRYEFQQRQAEVIAEREKRRADQSAMLSARSQLLDHENELFDPNNATGVYSYRGKDALGLTDVALPAFDKKAKDIRSGLGNEDQRFAFDELAAQQRNHLNDRLTSYMVPENEAYQKNAYLTYYATSRETAAQAARQGDAARFRSERDLAHSAIVSYAHDRGLPDSFVKEQQDQWTSYAHSNAVTGLLAENKLAASKQYFKANEGEMLEDDRNKALNGIRVEQNRLEAEAKQNAAIARADFNDRVQNASAMALSIGYAKNAPSKSEFLRVYGPEEGARRYADFEVIQRSGAEQQAYRGMSFAEQEADLTKTKPTAETENFATEQKAWEVKAQLAERARTEFHSDPAAFALKNSPTVRAAYVAMQQVSDNPDPFARRAASTAFVNAMRGEQARITGGEVGDVLPKAYVDSVASKFGKLTDEKPPDAVKLVRGLEQQWGDNWSDVYRELAPKLPGAALVIGSGMQDAPAALLAEASRMKDEDLTAGLPSGATSKARDALSAALDPFRKSLASNAGGGRTYATFFGSAEKLTLSYMRQGMDATKAAERAARDTVNEKYAFTETYRIPLVTDRARVDVNAVEVGAKVAQRSLDAAGLTLPVEPGYTSEQTKERYQARLREQSYWVTDPHERGLILHGPNGAAIQRTDGTPYLLTWAQLANPKAAAAQSVDDTDFARYNPLR